MDDFNHRYNRNDDRINEGPVNGEDEDIVETNINGTPTPLFTRDDRDEEVASELSTVDFDDDRINPDRKDDDIGAQARSVPGWIALALSILSFFIMPIILGGAGIIVGFIARNRDSEWLGNTAIVAGAISILIALFVRPFVY